MNSYPSIFNDVIGPVMRGPSSSHCAASLRIGRLCRDLMEGDIKEVYIEFDPNGSLATTHKGQGSDMGLFGGFLGWEAYDERLPNYLQAVDEAGIKIVIDIHPIGATHPNTYKITLKNDKETRSVIALSTGGGMIQVIEIDGAPVLMAGDFYETLVYVKSGDQVVKFLQESVEVDEINIRQGDATFIEVKSDQFLTEGIIEELMEMKDVLFVKKLSPVLPVLARKDLSVPFITTAEMLEYNEGKNLSLWELAVHYESARGNISHDEVFVFFLTFLYILMGVSAGIVWSKGYHHIWVKTALYHFVFQLLLNGLWSIVFFGLKNPLWGLVVILALLSMIMLTIKWFRVISRPAALMLIPYLLWVAFASALNYKIWELNP